MISSVGYLNSITNARRDPKTHQTPDLETGLKTELYILKSYFSR